MKYFLVIIISIISIKISHSQSIEDKTGAWYTYGGTHKISEKFSINTGTQLWLYETTENFHFILLHAGLSYYVSPKFVTTICYGYTDIDSGFNTNTEHSSENRLYEQITYKHKILKLPIDYRLRIEHRFFNLPNSKKTRHRLRSRIGTKIKLNKTFFIRLNNEFLATFQNDILTENRFYSALGINIYKSINLQLGYLNQKIKGLNLHRLQVGVFIKTNHIKKK